jgi:hypothetical protein
MCLCTWWREVVRNPPIRSFTHTLRFHVFLLHDGGELARFLGGTVPLRGTSVKPDMSGNSEMSVHGVWDVIFALETDTESGKPPPRKIPLLSGF